MGIKANKSTNRQLPRKAKKIIRSKKMKNHKNQLVAQKPWWCDHQGILASILITTYEKNKELPNVFYSISQQKTDFEFEVCVLDDCSLVDPKPIYDQYLQVKHKKYVRFKQHVGNRAIRGIFKIHPNFTSSYGHTLLMVADESEIVIDGSADVLWTQPDILQRLVDGMRLMEVQLCRVINMPVDPNLHENWETGITNLLIESTKYGDYQGSKRGPFDENGQNIEWYPFLIPFYKGDCLDPNKINYLNDNRDTTISGVLHSHGYKPIYHDGIIAIHQMHPNHPTVCAMHDADLMNWGPQHPERQEYDN